MISTPYKSLLDPHKERPLIVQPSHEVLEIQRNAIEKLKAMSSNEVLLEEIAKQKKPGRRTIWVQDPDGRQYTVDIHAPEDWIDNVRLAIRNGCPVIVIDSYPFDNEQERKPIQGPLTVSYQVGLREMPSVNAVEMPHKHQKHNKPWGKRNRNKVFGVRHAR